MAEWKQRGRVGQPCHLRKRPCTGRSGPVRGTWKQFYEKQKEETGLHRHTLLENEVSLLFPQNSVPFPSVGMAGAIDLEMSYLIDFLLFRWINNWLLFQFQLFQLVFWQFHYPLFLYITIYILISYIVYRRSFVPHFLTGTFGTGTLETVRCLFLYKAIQHFVK